MAVVFWDAQVVILVDFLELDLAINSEVLRNAKKI